ncbi:MAG TPA: ATP-binding cassette domain-containing protein [Candidatus Binataceae bacterium]|jgi:phospholipid/cholesterol/gamma-HCH transport system ATP-binding protein|nr:ATP-binding cassette domain-containing protein [Candidatus Binataceae bacterium]
MTTDNSNPIAIRVSGLRRRFGPQQVLGGVDLQCPRGQITTIVGPSGCGKTVFLKHLTLLMRPDAGQIVINGVDITGLSSRALDTVREQFGVLFQGGALFDSLTVFENVAFPLVEKTKLGRKDIEAAVNDRLAAVSLEGVGHKYPSEISGGMQKRAALARALIRKPNILYLDEPTTGLDPTRTGAIHDLIRRTREKFELTVVMVSHDVPQVFEISDRVAFMHEGKMWLNGTVAEVMEAHDSIFEGFLAGRASDDEDIPAAPRAETRV